MDAQVSKCSVSSVYDQHFLSMESDAAHLIIVAPVRQFLTFGAAVRAPGARTRPNAAPSTWCGSFMTKDRN